MSDFLAAMAARSDAELLEIVNAPDGTWRDEALNAAREELTRRGVAIPSREAAETTRAAELAVRAQVPLDAIWIVAAILLPMCFFPWLLMASSFEQNGYLKKARTLRWLALVPAALLAGLVLVTLITTKLFGK